MFPTPAGLGAHHGIIKHGLSISANLRVYLDYYNSYLEANDLVIII